jgi:hypothetical protein
MLLVYDADPTAHMIALNVVEGSLSSVEKSVRLL